MMEPFIDVQIPLRGIVLEGKLSVPNDARGIVVFAHGSGSSRFSRRNIWEADYLQRHGFATLLFDLLTAEEDAIDTHTRQFRFDIPTLAKRLSCATRWLIDSGYADELPVGYFGASTGAAAALIAASELGERISAVVSRGGRPDLAGGALVNVISPVLLIVGGSDEAVIELNREAYEQLACRKEVRVIPGAAHLFEEPGTLEQVAELAAAWYSQYFPASKPMTDRVIGKGVSEHATRRT